MLLSAAFHNARNVRASGWSESGIRGIRHVGRQGGNESLRAVAQSAEEKATYLRVE